MRTRPVRLALAAPLAAAFLTLAACGETPASQEAGADAANAEASAAPDAAPTDLVAEPTGAKVDVKLPETPMTNTPAEGAKAP